MTADGRIERQGQGVMTIGMMTPRDVCMHNGENNCDSVQFDGAGRTKAYNPWWVVGPAVVLRSGVGFGFRFRVK